MDSIDFFQEWECIKTGGDIRVANMWLYGDLFAINTPTGIGSKKPAACVMNVASWSPLNKGILQVTRFNAEFHTYHQWFGQYEDRSHNVSVIILPVYAWFTYEGKIIL